MADVQNWTPPGFHYKQDFVKKVVNSFLAFLLCLPASQDSVFVVKFDKNFKLKDERNV